MPRSAELPVHAPAARERARKEGDVQLIENYKKKKAIKSYINKLGKDLARRYGKSKIYTSAQVNKTAQDENYNLRHICYAHAMYTSMKHFDKWHEEKGESCDYMAMREEVANDHFSGNISSFESACITSDDSFGMGGDSGGGSD